MTDQQIDEAWQALGQLRPDERPFSFFENWPGWLFYTPVALSWVWNGLRFGGMTLPALADPAIEHGGLCGESKFQVFKLLGTIGAQHLAPAVYLRVMGDLLRDTAAARTLIQDASLAYPLIAKPDVSRRGTGVKLIQSEDDLSQYLAHFPVAAGILLQRYIAAEGEAGVFYVRMPGEQRGRILSLTLKYFPSVRGDGHSTLRELILKDRRAGRIAKTYFLRHSSQLERVIPKDEIVRLVSVGNHIRGAIFRDGTRFVTSELEERFDQIAQEIPNFMYGRFDVRFESFSTFCKGKDFSIIEVNGAGGEATHIWDRSAKLFEAYRTYGKLVRASFVLGAYHRTLLGLKPPSAFALISNYLSERKLLAQYPDEE